MAARAHPLVPLVLAALLISLHAGAVAQPAPADARARKLTTSAMQKSYGAKDYRGAVQKLEQAVALCEKEVCTPSVHANVYAALAIVHWNGTEDFDAAVEALRAMVRLDPKHPLDENLATEELGDALDTAREDVRTEGEGAAGVPSAAETSSNTDDPNLDPKEREFRRQVAARKAANAREAEEARIKAEAEAVQAEAEAKRQEAARKAAERRKAKEERRAAARKLATEKKELLHRAAEQRKAEAIRLAAETQKQEEEKREFYRKAAEDKQADLVRKAEEAKKEKEEQRLKTPFKAGKLEETPVRRQAVGYPIPVYVKLPPPPRGIEQERTDVVKVQTQYYGPNTPVPVNVELKSLGNGGYGGLIACDTTWMEGTVTYFTIAFNKYDNLVAFGGTPAKPHAVEIKGALGPDALHLPGDAPPKACAETQAQAAEAAGPPCAADKDCPDAGVCAQKTCATRSPATPMPGKPRWRACIGCRIGAADDGPPVGIVMAMAIALARLLPRRRRASIAPKP